MMSGVQGKRSVWAGLVFTTTLLFAGCGPADDGSDLEEAGPYGANVETCGGKCDSTSVGFELIDSMRMMEPESVDGESEAFRLAAEVVSEHTSDVESGTVATAGISVAEPEEETGTVLERQLTYHTADDRPEAETGAFVSENIDGGELGDWDRLRVRIFGDHGEESFDQIFEFASGESQANDITAEEGPFGDGYDVDAAVITIDPEVSPPANYSAPRVDGPFNLAGTEFWQRWPNGHSPTYSYGDGTEAGQKCMTASKLRFAAIMEEPPAALVQLEEESNWSGRFFNWNDDYSHETASRSADSAALWAWRTSLVKWISQTGDDGRCFLPTRDLVERAAENCLETARQNDGEIEGCQAP